MTVPSFLSIRKGFRQTFSTELLLCTPFLFTRFSFLFTVLPNISSSVLPSPTHTLSKTAVTEIYLHKRVFVKVGFECNIDKRCLVECLKLSFTCGTGTAELVMVEDFKHIYVRGDISQNHKIMETGKDIWRCSSSAVYLSRVSWSRLLRVMHSQGLSISKDGDFTAFLGSL